MNEFKTDNDTDIQAASKALVEAEEQGTVPWESIKASLNLGRPPAPASPGAAPARAKPTNYVVYDPGKVGEKPLYVRLGPCVNNLGLKVDCDWHWTSDHAKASKMSRAKAIAFTRETTAKALANGHRYTLEIRPATGGMPITIPS